MDKLSVVIVAHNEEKNIEDCLRSVEWADEIIVVDGQSSDRTAEIARKYTDKVYVKENAICEVLRIFGYSKAGNEWVLFLDADERVTAELKKEIDNVLAGREAEASGYYLLRKNNFYGTFVHYGSPDYHLRLFKRSKLKKLPERLHGFIELSGSIKRLKESFLHFPFKNISEHIERLNFYSDVVASSLCQRKTLKIRWYNFGWYFVLWPAACFFKNYFFMKGWKDGFRGVVLSWISSSHEFLKYAKYLEKCEWQKNK